MLGSISAVIYYQERPLSMKFQCRFAAFLSKWCQHQNAKIFSWEIDEQIVKFLEVFIYTYLFQERDLLSVTMKVAERSLLEMKNLQDIDEFIQVKSFKYTICICNIYLIQVKILHWGYLIIVFFVYILFSRENRFLIFLIKDVLINL